MAALALILALANMYTTYNIMSEVENLRRDMDFLEQSVERIIIEEIGNLTRYNFMFISTSEMQIVGGHEPWANAGPETVSFWSDGEMAIFNVNLPLNTTYRLDILANSGPQRKPEKKGSALEIVIDGQSWGIVTFTTEEWSWEYLGIFPMYTGLHEIKLISREGGALMDTDITFNRVRILWLRE